MIIFYLVAESAGVAVFFKLFACSFRVFRLRRTRLPLFYFFTGSVLNANQQTSKTAVHLFTVVITVHAYVFYSLYMINGNQQAA